MRHCFSPTCPGGSLWPCCSCRALPLLYPDVGPDDRLRLEPVHKVLLLILVPCLRSSWGKIKYINGSISITILNVSKMYKVRSKNRVSSHTRYTVPWTLEIKPAVESVSSPVRSFHAVAPLPWRSRSWLPAERGHNRAAAAQCPMGTCYRRSPGLVLCR